MKAHSWFAHRHSHTCFHFSNYINHHYILSFPRLIKTSHWDKLYSNLLFRTPSYISNKWGHSSFSNESVHMCSWCICSSFHPYFYCWFQLAERISQSCCKYLYEYIIIYTPFPLEAMGEEDETKGRSHLTEIMLTENFQCKPALNK